MAVTAQTVLKHRTYTKEEMAKIEHEIRGDFAYTDDGRVFIWDRRFGHWARWK